MAAARKHAPPRSCIVGRTDCHSFIRVEGALLPQHMTGGRRPPSTLSNPFIFPWQTKSLWSELKATRDAATSTRQVYEGTVKQREDWRKAIEEGKRAKIEAAERYVGRN